MYDRQRAEKLLDGYLRRKEGEKLSPYLCIAGVPTIGVGATTYPDGRKVTLQDPPITKAQMDRMLQIEIDRYIDAVLPMVNHNVTTGQLVGLVLCGYNIGLPSLAKSSMVRLHNAGDYAGAGRAFGLWNKYRNPKTRKLEVSKALTARRLQEASIYLSDSFPAEHAPQAVIEESRLPQSPLVKLGSSIALGGVGTIATTAPEEAPVPTLAQVSEGASTVQTLISTLQSFVPPGVTPGMVFGAALILAGCAVVYWRWRQRSEGWA